MTANRSRYRQSYGQVNVRALKPRNNNEVIKFSRSQSASNYTRIRRQRKKRRNLLLSVAVTLASLLVVTIAAIAIYTNVINGKLATGYDGKKHTWDDDTFITVTPDEPFWILLLGSDDREWMSDIPRTDTIILARVDQPNKTFALISIPRDTYVNIPGHGMNKINSAYTFGELYDEGKGIQLVVRTVSEFAGIDIAYFAMINFDGFENLVNALDGVEVDVPVDINDIEAGDDIIYKGLQTLNGSQALTFVRSRDFAIADYQRTANQRTFLQALARKVLSTDPKRIADTITSIAEMTFTNIKLDRIINIARSMQGMQESDMHTYHLPSYIDDVYIDGYLTNCVIAYDELWRHMIEEIEAGRYPQPQDDSYAGVVPDDYVAREKSIYDLLAKYASPVRPSDYVVEVRNGCGIEGSARSVSEKLSAAGYGVGEIGDMDSIDYSTTRIIFKDASCLSAASDIQKQLGYGTIVASSGAYRFNGDILVIVGKDYHQ